MLQDFINQSKCLGFCRSHKVVPFHVVNYKSITTDVLAAHVLVVHLINHFHYGLIDLQIALVNVKSDDKIYYINFQFQ